LEDRTDKYLNEWSKKRDAWLRSGRKDESYLLRGEELSAFRKFVISDPRRVTSDDRGFLLACDRRADTSEMLRSQDIEALLIEQTQPGVAPDPPPSQISQTSEKSQPSQRSKPPLLPPPLLPPPLPAPSAPPPIATKQTPAGRKWTGILLAANVVLILSMLAIGWMVKGLLVQLHESRSELQKTQTTLLKKTEEIGQVHDDLTEKSKTKAALEKDLPEVKTRRDDESKVLDTLMQNRRSAEEQLKAVESSLAIAQEEFSKQRGRKPKGKLKVEYDRLLIKRLLLMLPPRCPKDLAECTDESIQESVRKLIPNGSLRDVVSPLPHVVVYPRSAANNPKLMPLREGQLRKLLKSPGDKNDLLVIVSPRLSDEKREAGEARYQTLSGFLQKSLKLPPERLLRINQTNLFSSSVMKGLAPVDRPKKGEITPLESIWVVRTPGPRPLAAPAAPQP